MNFWTFLDRNWFFVMGPGLIVLCLLADCGKRDVVHPGCGVSININSADAGSQAPSKGPDAPR